MKNGVQVWIPIEDRAVKGALAGMTGNVDFRLLVRSSVLTPKHVWFFTFFEEVAISDAERGTELWEVKVV